MRHVGPLLALLIATAPPLVAQDACDSPATQDAVTMCATRDAQRSTQRLAALLRELADSLDSTRQSGLQNAQGQWTRYLEAQCEWDAQAFDGGSVAAMRYEGCVASGTEARIAELKIHLCEGEGMTGECPSSHRYDLAVTRPPASQ